MLDLSWRFDAWFEALPRSPRDHGRVERCVVRTGRGTRAMPASIEVSVEQGVVGDSWIAHPHSAPGNQVSLINVHVLRSVAGGDEARMALSGDNLHVDLELSEANLPIGTLLSIGGVLLRVSPVAHRPCRNFVERFGAKAAKQVARAWRIGRRGRGVLCEVVRGGTIRTGDGIQVQRASA
jgi:MOSC domain-containing protein YiiM